MKRFLAVIILIFIVSACAKDKITNDTLKAMETDYLSGKMDRQTYLNRKKAIENSPSWQNYSKEQNQEELKRLQRERYYREFQSFYVNPQEQEGPVTSCYRNLDGGITCLKN
jgi:hypothetical protein